MASDKQQKETILEEMKKWCEVIILFIGHRYNDLEFMETELDILHKVAKSKSMTQMRMFYSDTNEMCGALSYIDLIDLNKDLRRLFGQDLNTVNKKLQKKALTIIKRGAIKNDEEFYQMKPFIDYLLWTGDSQDEENARELDRILCEYEQNSHPH